MALPPSKSAKNDLLVRVRYPHSLPPPPFPPKLLSIDLDPKRFSNHAFLKALDDERELPMVADLELGMPLELGAQDIGYWDGTQEPESAHSFATLDPQDQELFAEPAQNARVKGVTPASSSAFLSRTEVRKPDAQPRRSDVSFSDSAPRKVSSRMPTPKADFTERSRAERIGIISGTFDHANSKDTSSIRHPNKPHLTAVESCPLLPDTNLWANDYSLMKFADPPQTSIRSAGAPNAPDTRERFETAIFRPIQDPHEEAARISYYLLPQQADINSQLERIANAQQVGSIDDLDEETVREATKKTAAQYLEERRRKPTIDEQPDAPLNSDEQFEYEYARDYEAVNEQQLRGDFLLSIKEDPEQLMSASPGDSKFAAFALLQSSYTLRKQRPNVRSDEERSGTVWDAINVKVGGSSGTERRTSVLNAMRP